MKTTYRAHIFGTKFIRLPQYFTCINLSSFDNWRNLIIQFPQVIRSVVRYRRGTRSRPGQGRSEISDVRRHVLNAFPIKLSKHEELYGVVSLKLFMLIWGASQRPSTSIHKISKGNSYPLLWQKPRKIKICILTVFLVENMQAWLSYFVSIIAFLKICHKIGQMPQR